MSSRDAYYFDTFVELTDYACMASGFLIKVIQNYDPENLAAWMKDMHKTEHDCDLKKHAMIEKLSKEFITPIEREDIMELAHLIDEVTDSIEDVLMRFYMYNIRTLRPEALVMAKVIQQCCTALKEAMGEFANFRKSKTLHQLIIEVNRLEEDGDRHYTEATRALYTSGASPVEISAWTHIFHFLEKCCDACENVSDVVESVMMKNS
jgi:predicted phosphate transport protein (TIGR00153 family)